MHASRAQSANFVQKKAPASGAFSKNASRRGCLGFIVLERCLLEPRLYNKHQGPFASDVTVMACAETVHRGFPAPRRSGLPGRAVPRQAPSWRIFRAISPFAELFLTGMTYAKSG